MKKSLPILLFMCATVIVQAQSKQEQQVLQLSKQKFKWMVGKNSDSLNYVLDDRLSFIHSNGWVQTKKELMDDLASGKLNYENIDVVSASARLYPKSAVVTGRGKFVATLNGNTNTYELAYTETYVLQRREWKLVSRHASRVQ